MTPDEKPAEEVSASFVSSETGLPVWAKLLIGLVIFVVVGLAAVVMLGSTFIKNATKTDPAAIEKLAESMMEIESPPPKDWKYVFGFDAGLVKTFGMLHESSKETDQQIIYFASMPSNSKEKETPDDMADKMLKMGLSTPDATAHFESVSQKGKETVAGTEMPYITGTMASRDGKKFSGMTACLVNPDQHKTLFIYGIQYKGENYNLDLSNQVIKAIKKF